MGCDIKWLLKRYPFRSFQILSTIVVSPASSVLLVNITVCTTVYIGVNTFIKSNDNSKKEGGLFFRGYSNVDLEVFTLKYTSCYD